MRQPQALRRRDVGGVSTERKIGGNVFCVTPLPAMRSFTLQPRLAPALAAVAEGIGAIGNLAEKQDLDAIELAAIAPVVTRFFHALPPDRLEMVTRELLAGATMDGRPLFTAEGNPFDVLMRGRSIDVWKLLWFALEVNYPDFFGAVAGKGARPAAANPSEASTTSPTSGPSTG